MNREEWLEKATSVMNVLFVPDYDVGDVRVSVGFPSHRALSNKRRAIGQCWGGKVAEDGVPHIFISPLLKSRKEVLETLLHEMAHAAVGTECGHKGEFVKCIRYLGLEGKPTSTVAGEELAERLRKIGDGLGDYPHSALVPAMLEKKKQGTRLLKVMCVECDFIGRFSRRALDEIGYPVCPCGREMEDA